MNSELLGSLCAGDDFPLRSPRLLLPPSLAPPPPHTQLQRQARVAGAVAPEGAGADGGDGRGRVSVCAGAQTGRREGGREGGEPLLLCSPLRSLLHAPHSAPSLTSSTTATLLSEPRFLTHPAARSADDPRWRFEFPDPGAIGVPVLQVVDVAFGYNPAKPLFSCVGTAWQWRCRGARIDGTRRSPCQRVASSYLTLPLAPLPATPLPAAASSLVSTATAAWRSWAPTARASPRC
jgi:hypothetical protein